MMFLFQDAERIEFLKLELNLINLIFVSFFHQDSQRYRIGTNYQQIPVNCPYRVSTRNYQRGLSVV